MNNNAKDEMHEKIKLCQATSSFGGILETVTVIRMKVHLVGGQTYATVNSIRILAENSK